MSWKQDDRNRTKRNNMRTFKKQHYRNISKNGKDSPSNNRAQIEPPYNRVLVDIADSSDDKLSFRSNTLAWSPINSDEELNEKNQAPDFETLQNMPTGNSYTTLSSEKDWEIDPNTKNDAKTMGKISYFTLNLALINAGLETIPFYKRMDYNSSMFDKQEIKRMNLEAEFAESNYQVVLNNYEFDKPDSKRSSGKSKSNKVSEVVNDESNLNDEIDEISNLVEKSKINVKDENEDKPNNASLIENPNPEQLEEKTAVSNQVEEMQDWLDQVLE